MSSSAIRRGRSRCSVLSRNVMPSRSSCGCTWPRAATGSIGSRGASPRHGRLQQPVHRVDAARRRSARVEVVYAPVEANAARVPRTTASDNGRVVIIQVSRMEPLEGARRAAGRARAIARSRGLDVPARRRSAAPARGAVHGRRSARRRPRSASPIASNFSASAPTFRRLLAGSDIYCQPNIEPEPFGISLIEAMAAGLPVVTSALGGAKEIVDETCGVLVAPRDAAALASQLSGAARESRPSRASRRERPGSGRARCAIRPRRCRASPRFCSEAASACDADEDCGHQLPASRRRREARRHRAGGARARRRACAPRPHGRGVLPRSRNRRAPPTKCVALPWKSFVETWAGLRMTAGYLGNVLALQVDVREFDVVIAHGDSLLLSMGRSPSCASCTAARGAKRCTRRRSAVRSCSGVCICRNC